MTELGLLKKERRKKQQSGTKSSFERVLVWYLGVHKCKFKPDRQFQCDVSSVCVFFRKV